VAHGEEEGYVFRAGVNAPLSDTFAIRASAFTRQDPGYIENVETGQRGINEADVYGGRLATLWRPTDSLSLKFSALYQNTKTDGSSAEDPGLGLAPWQQSVVRGVGEGRKEIQAYSLTLNAKFGTFDFTSLTGYSSNKASDSFDFSYYVGQFLSQPLFGVGGAPLFEDFRTNKFTQEIRLSTPITQSVDWLLGGFYTHEVSPNIQNIYAADPTTGVVRGGLASFNFFVTYAEYAAFTDVTLHLTDQFDIQLGARESQIRQSYAEVDSGPYVPAADGSGFTSPAVFPEVVTHANAFTYLVTPQFKISPDLMIYMRLASGYRPGGPNATASLFGLPESYEPDKTTNYEIGTKGDVLNHLLSFDASVYYIDWRNIQLSLTDPANGQTYYANGSRAKSQGLELSLESKPLNGLTLSAWGAWNDAVLTRALPPTAAYGADGDRLPFATRFSGNLAAEERFPVTDKLEGFVGATLSYIGDRLGEFTAVPPRQYLPGYAKADLRAGGRYDSWTLNLFVNNVADRRGVLSGGLGSVFPFSFNYLPPRTAGILIAKTF
jgi:outer membrane receptor protein involved in Fe transport